MSDATFNTFRGPSGGLPEIPLRALGKAGPVALMESDRERAEALLAAGSAPYPRAAVRLGDRLSRRWLKKQGNPLLAEIEAVAGYLEHPGAHFLNVSYEWGCTTAVTPAPEGHPRFVRVLDWPLEGLGRNLVAAHHESAQGPWVNLTWPGFVGAVQAVAPGRFAACFNQAPLMRHSGSFYADWAVERVRVWRRRALPPAHLLRLAFESCADYAAARAFLAETPVALPAIFVLAGTKPGEGCVIERLPHLAALREMPTGAANHWESLEKSAFGRGTQSETRRARMAACLTEGESGPDFAWLEPPILNPTTRLALVAEPAAGRLTAMGFEADGPATRRLVLEGVEKVPLEAA